MSVLSPITRALDSAGAPVASAEAYYYEPGTTTPKTVYQDPDLGTAHANPVVADANGFFPPVYLDPEESYRITIKTSGGATTLQDVAEYDAGAPGTVILTPEHFGAVGDGTTDDYDALKALATFVGKQRGGRVLFGQNKVYKIDRYQVDVQGTPPNDPNDPDNSEPSTGDIHIRWSDCVGLEIDMNGAKIDVKGDFYRPTRIDNANYRDRRSVVPFMFQGCRDLTLKNGEVDQNVDAMTRGDTAETFAPCIGFHGCTRVLVENMYVHHSLMDGFYVVSDNRFSPYRTNRNVTMINCRSRHNARQGMSVISCRGMKAVNCDFSYTGVSAGTYGNHAPSAGVDIEPDYAVPDVEVKTGELVFDRCSFVENVGWSFVATSVSKTDDVMLRDCYCFQSTYPSTSCGAVIGAVQQLKIEGGYFWNVGIWPGYGRSESDSLQMDGYARGVTIEGDHANFRPFLCDMTDGPRFSIAGCTIRHTAETDPSAYMGTGYQCYWKGTNLRLEDNSIFVAKELHNPATATNYYVTLARGLVRGNRWESDLSDTAKKFIVNYHPGTAGTTPRAYAERFSGGRIGPDATFPADFGTGPFAAGDAETDSLTLGLGGNARYRDVGTAAPTTGDARATWARGDIRWNANPSAGGKVGWVCTTGGAAGTAVFKPFGAIDA